MTPDTFSLRALAYVSDAVDRKLAEARSRALHPSTRAEALSESVARLRSVCLDCVSDGDPFPCIHDTAEGLIP